MKKLNSKICVLLVLPILSGCFSIKVDEQTAFQPPKRDVGPATSVAELDARMAERFQGGVEQGAWRLSDEPGGGIRVTFREDFRKRPAGQAVPAPKIVRNGFIGEGDGRIAWTYYQKVTLDARASNAGRPLVVHCAGNAADRYNSGLNYANKALPFADVLVFDYPGYGDSPGPASAASFEAAARSVSDYVARISSDRNLVFWGHSLGGFVCSRLAAATPSTDGLILETTAPNAAAVARAWTPAYARLFVRTSVAPSLASYDVVADAAKVNGPILVLGAAKDEVLPVDLARQVGDGLKARNVNVTYQEFPEGRHETVPSQPQFAQILTTFFQSLDQSLEKPNP